MDREQVARNILALLAYQFLSPADAARAFGVSKVFIGKALTPPFQKLSENQVDRFAEYLGTTSQKLTSGPIIRL